MAQPRGAERPRLMGLICGPIELPRSQVWRGAARPVRALAQFAYERLSIGVEGRGVIGNHHSRRQFG